ncbi:hypothetical protein F7725_006068 [Dissostichus mawsoni]|uniref:Uncharacterized protein n=1 Tax=Dissostichus mawsoni TaxID=36200 RepID=A0A7J5YU60_DISMA|nr:hypothetical protein F7725_006068 [Dissostichus mawsoni]
MSPPHPHNPPFSGSTLGEVGGLETRRSHHERPERHQGRLGPEKRDEWAEAIQTVAESLAKQEEEGILCSPSSAIENVNEEEMDTSIGHYKRKVTI